MKKEKKIFVALFGSAGRMGEALIEQISKNTTMKLVGCVDREMSLKDLKNNKPDVVIEFSSPAGTIEIAKWCAENKVALVSGTTGLNQTAIESLRAAGKKIPVLSSPNMSLGLNAMIEAVKTYLQSFQTGEVSVEETHHKNKKDRPSGTAKLLEETLRKNKSSGVQVQDTQSIRGGDVFGIHKVTFFSEGEWVLFEHSATNRKVFAQGAITAAQWVLKQKAGLYEMKDFIEGSINKRSSRK